MQNNSIEMNYTLRMNLGVVLLLNCPKLMNFGIDFSQWTIGDKFMGIKLIPLGPHFITYSLKEENHSFKQGFFINVMGKEKIHIRKWNADVGDFLTLKPEEDENFQIGVQNLDFDAYLGSYPIESYENWIDCTKFITGELINKLEPISKKYITQSKEYEVEGDLSVKGNIYFTAIRKKIFSLRTKTDPKELTKLNIDKSNALENLIINEFKDDHKLLLGEYQYAFVTFIIGEMYESFEQWREIFVLVASCYEYISKNERFFCDFMECTYHQFRNFPKDFFYDEITKNNFLNRYLENLITNLLSSNISSVVKRAKLFQKFLKEHFVFSIKDENERIIAKYLKNEFGVGSSDHMDNYTSGILSDIDLDDELPVIVPERELNPPKEETEDTCNKVKSTTIERKTIKEDESKIVEETITETKTTAHFRVGSIDEAPDYLVDNQYIKHGYRVNCNSVKHITKSLFVLHNESVNIWSHLLGAVFIIVLIFYTTVYIRSHKDQIMDNIPFNLTKVNSELHYITEPIVNILPNLHNITESIGEKYENSKSIINFLASTVYDKTTDFIETINNKIGLYSGCKHCFNTIGDVVEKLKNSLTDNVSIYKAKVVNETHNLLESMEDSKVMHFIEDFNGKLGELKEKVFELFDNNESIWNNDFVDSPRNVKKWPLFIMLFSAVICLSCSAIFHLFSAHSAHLQQWLNRLDYAGISILIAGSCYPPYSYFFYCVEKWRIFYLSFITIFAVSVFFYSFQPSFTSPKKIKLRGTLFLVLGLSAGIPIVHLALLDKYIIGFEVTPSLIFWYLGGISYVVGALTYICRVPERFRPGKHDIWGHSHQIFHFFVLVGVICHYLGCLDSYYYRIENPCPAL